MIPINLREEMLSKIHGATHFSLTKCRERIKMSVWWSKISLDIDKWMGEFCQINLRKQKAKPLNPTPLSQRPWKEIGMDLCEVDGKTYLFIVDYFSRWFKMDKLFFK